jgi:hypothetical protein
MNENEPLDTSGYRGLRLVNAVSKTEPLPALFQPRNPALRWEFLELQRIMAGNHTVG